MKKLLSVFAIFNLVNAMVPFIDNRVFLETESSSDIEYTYLYHSESKKFNKVFKIPLNGVKQKTNKQIYYPLIHLFENKKDDTLI